MARNPDNYIPLDQLEVGAAYKLHARNIRVGVWDGTHFHGIRRKFGTEFMDSELHYQLEDGDYLGTAHAICKLVEPMAPGCK